MDCQLHIHYSQSHPQGKSNRKDQYSLPHHNCTLVVLGDNTGSVVVLLLLLVVVGRNSNNLDRALGSTNNRGTGAPLDPVQINTDSR